MGKIFIVECGIIDLIGIDYIGENGKIVSWK